MRLQALLPPTLQRGGMTDEAPADGATHLQVLIRATRRLETRPASQPRWRSCGSGNRCENLEVQGPGLPPESRGHDLDTKAMSKLLTTRGLLLVQVGVKFSWWWERDGETGNDGFKDACCHWIEVGCLWIGHAAVLVTITTTPAARGKPEQALSHACAAVAMIQTRKAMAAAGPVRSTAAEVCPDCGTPAEQLAWVQKRPLGREAMMDVENGSSRESPSSLVRCGHRGAAHRLLREKALQHDGDARLQAPPAPGLISVGSQAWAGLRILQLETASKPAEIQTAAERLASGRLHDSRRLDSDRVCRTRGGAPSTAGCARSARGELLLHSTCFHGTEFGG